MSLINSHSVVRLHALLPVYFYRTRAIRRRRRSLPGLNTLPKTHNDGLVSVNCRNCSFPRSRRYFFSALSSR